MKKTISILIMIIGAIICLKYGGAIMRNITELIICDECSIVGHHLRMMLENVSISIPLSLMVKRFIMTIIGMTMIVIGFPKEKEVKEED